MPKSINYNKGSIIYFEGDNDERIFVLQKGAILLKSIDIENGNSIVEQINAGGFFGVKSAFGHFPREETANVVVDSTCLSMTVQEFETLFSSNKQVILKMLKVFSGQLREIHKKINSILHNFSDTDPMTGMQMVAQNFYDDEQFKTCCDVCEKFLKRYPQAPNINKINNLYAEAKKRADVLGKKEEVTQSSVSVSSTSGILKQFALPAFSRFAKTYEPGSVIISEFEPGDCFYLIQSGQVQLVKCINGTKKNLDILKPGEFFGEMAILENTPRSATCLAYDRVEVLEFNKENFEVLIMGNPQLAIILIKLFCKRINDQRRRLKTLVIKDTSARVGDVFVMFDEMNPKTSGDASRRFNLTIQDISHWSGLPLEIVKEEVSRFAEKHRIEVFNDHIIVKNIVDMKRYVEQHLPIR